MGFWPFGQARDVESASRIVTAPTRDNLLVRGKLTLYFNEPQTQEDADEAADRCAQTAEGLFREIPGPDQLLENEASLVPTLLQRLPAGLAAMIRSAEIAALHVVGDPGSATRRRPASVVPPPGASADLYGGSYGALQARPGSWPDTPGGTTPRPPSSIPQPPPSSPARPVGYPSRPPPSGLPPPSTVRPPPSANTPQRRRSGSSSVRAISASLIPPAGAPPAVVGTSLSPLLRDAGTRVLLGCLRAHDLIAVRGIPLDDGATELLAALVPVSEAPPGEFEASRSAEIARWQGILGAPTIDALRAEAWVLSAFQAHLALLRVGIAPGVVATLVEALCQGAFATPNPLSPATQIARYAEPTLSAEAARNVARILRHPGAGPLELALSPLLDSVQSDMDAMAQLAKVSLGLLS